MAQTAETIVNRWEKTAETQLQDGRVARAGSKRTLTKLLAMTRLVKTDLGTFIEEEKGEAHALSPVHLEALALLAASRPAPQRVQQKLAKAAAPPTAPEDLLKRGFHRTAATRAVAATQIGEADPLTLALGFHTPVEQSQEAISKELARQRLVILQKDERGRDFDGAVPNRAKLGKAGLTEGYAKRKIDPLLAEFAPFLAVQAPALAPIESLALWERTVIVAASEFLVAAERVIDDPARVVKYRSAQPLSQAGRFTKAAIAKRAAATEKRKEKAAARKAKKLAGK